MSPHLAPVISEPPSPFDAIKNTDTETGTEFWSARDLMPLMGYPRWNEFKVPLERAMKSAEVQGNDVATLFRGSAEKTSGRPREDFHLTRFAAYLVAMNGDPNKPEVAAAQAYFAIKTREAETAKAPAELTRREILTLALEAEEKAEEQRQLAEKRQRALEAAKPKVEYYDHCVSIESDVMTVKDWGAHFGLTEPQARQKLLDAKMIYRKVQTREWSSRKGDVVDRNEYRAYAAYRNLFDLRAQHNAPRYHNGQVRQTLYVRAGWAITVAKNAGIEVDRSIYDILPESA